ncbi:MAG: Fe-S cluster assembly protein SufD [Pseudomonadota bacterium]
MSGASSEAGSVAEWRAAFETFLGTDAAAMGPKTRTKAFERFAEEGVPTRRHEYWKYTTPRALTPATVVQARTTQDAFAGVDAFRLVFVDGRLDAARTDRDALAAAADVSGPDGAPWMDRVFGVLQGQPLKDAHRQVSRPIADLNLSLWSDGIALRVPKGVDLPKPIHLRYEGDAPAHLRIALLVEEGASATLLESGPGALTTGAEIVLERGAKLHHLRAQNEIAGQHYASLFTEIGEGAHFASFTLSADAELVRNETVMTLAGDSAVGHIAGALLAGGKSHIDNTIYVVHGAEHGESRQVFKNVLDGSAKGVFQGKILVQKGAQKTDGYQISQSLLLDERAEFNAKPELEIYADDVACSHGSTSGAIDETALFYLRSRGMERRTAEALLVAAFAEEAIAEIADDDLQEVMRQTVEAWMAQRRSDG